MMKPQTSPSSCLKSQHSGRILGGSPLLPSGQLLKKNLIFPLNSNCLKKRRRGPRRRSTQLSHLVKRPPPLG